MSKQIVALGKPAISSEQYPHPQVKKLFCGIDVGAEILAIAIIELDHPCVQREFANTVAGHKALLNWLKKFKAQVRVSLRPPAFTRWILPWLWRRPSGWR